MPLLKECWSCALPEALASKILIYVTFGLLEFTIIFTVTVFYQNAKQNRKHEKELLKMQLDKEEVKDSIKENDQYIELMELLKDYYK